MFCSSMRNADFMRFCIFFIISVAFGLPAWSHNPKADSVVMENNTHGLVLGGSYGSNLRFSGIKLLENQSYLSTDLTYAYKNLITANVALYHLPGIQPAVAFYDFSLGISHTFNSWFDASLTLSRYNTAEQLKETFFDNSNYFSVAAGVDWLLLYSNVAYSTMLSSDSRHYLKIANSHYFQISQLWDGNGQLWIDPSFNFILSNYDEGKTALVKGNKPPQGGGGVPVVEYSKVFGLSELELSLPMALDFKNTTLEVNPYYSFVVKKDAIFPSSSGFCLLVNLYIKLK